MAPARQRVSYVIPPPTDPVPRLQLPPYGLPRLGWTKPLLVPLESQHIGNGVTKGNKSAGLHPRHRLGVASLALDTCTQLAGRSTPEGILYTGGRDGMVISWDLEMPMKKRPEDSLKAPKARWEMMTGWGDDAIDEENEDDSDDGLNNYVSDGDVLGDVTEHVRKRRHPSAKEPLPYEQQWEINADSFESGKPSTFRQCAQMHSDWVNDILLCNHNQTVVSASSDGTVKAWNPHSNTTAEPSVIGSHSDYVRCLSHCRDQNWIASGSFDRTIKLWDLTRSSRTAGEPLVTLKSPETSGPKSSVYALAVDPYGSVVASGSPERVVRTWDPRSGKRTSKLVGHTDNIRAILISEDARYLLTGSADASIKLWSLASQRCIHTFTQHTESVWSLFSSHPSLEIFYSGDRSGLVCRVDVEGCSDVSEGECVVLCQDNSDRTLSSTEGINKIVAMDDELLWTASGSSCVKRWKMPQRRSIRVPSASFGAKEADSPLASNSPRTGSPWRSNSASYDTMASTRTMTPPPTSRTRLSVTPSLAGSIFTEHVDGRLYGLPYESLVRLTSANEAFTPFASMSRSRDPDVATLYSAASIMSVTRAVDVRPHLQSVFQHSSFQNNSPMRSETYGSSRSAPVAEETGIPMNNARADYEDREVASDAVPFLTTPDDVIHGDNGLVRSVILNDRMHALTVDTTGEVAVWDIVRSTCLGKFVREDVAAASTSGSTVNGDGDEREQSPREALETVRERIEGEAVVVPWSSVDTKTGILTVHLNDKCFDAEIYADEAGYGHERHFNDEVRLNIGKWVLRNLFIFFIREQQRALARRNREAHLANHESRMHRGSVPTHIDLNGNRVNTSPTASRRRSGSDSSRRSTTSPTSVTLTSPSMVPAVSLQVVNPRASPLLTPMIQLHATPKDIPLPPIPQSPVMGSNDPTPMPRPLTATTPGASKDSADYFSQPQRARSGSVTIVGEESGRKTPSQDTLATSAPTGGLMGRFRNFGRSSSKRTPSEIGGLSVVTPGGTLINPDNPAALEEASEAENVPLTPLQLLLANISLPPSSEAPGLSLPASTAIIISEETPSGWTTLYRGSVATTGVDVHALEEVLPTVILEYLLVNKAPTVPIVKVGFVLLPYPAKDSGEQLPELLNTSQSKLTASRFLRVRKLTSHVHDKLERIAAGHGSNSAFGTPRSSFDAQGQSHGRSSSTNSPTNSTFKIPRPSKGEEVYEIVCHDVVLPLDMTLAAVRQFVWRQAGELTMHYRKKPLVSGSSLHA